MIQAHQTVAQVKRIQSVSSKFDPLELIPRAYSISSATEFCGRGTGGATLTKLDVMAAVAASRCGGGDIGPELLMDYALVDGGLMPMFRDRIIERIRQVIGMQVSAPIYSETCAQVAAVQAYGSAVFSQLSSYERDPKDAIARELRVQYQRYLMHARSADDCANTSLNRAIARFKHALKRF